MVAAQAFGSMLYGYNRVVDYAKKREQFGKHIIKFQSIEHELVDMNVAC